MSMLDAALSWAARGFRVFPLAEGTKDQPLCSFTKEASTDEALIRAWWSDPMTGAVRSHNVGVLTTDMVVVDVDVRNAKPGLVNFLNLTGGFDTLTVRTPSGGYHCYWLLDRPWMLETADDRKRASKLQAAWVLLMGGDTQSKDLARVLRVPGTHNYKYSPPRDVQFVACNLDERWELETLAAMAAPFVESDRPAPAALPANDDDRLRTIAAQWLGGAVGRVRGAPDGQKHHTLLDAAITLGGDHRIFGNAEAGLDGFRADGADDAMDGRGAHAAKNDK